MLSNESVKVLKKELKYLQTLLKQEGKYLAPTGMKLLTKQLSGVKAKIQEANNRNVIGKTTDGVDVYTAPSAIEEFDGECLYIVGLPIVWSVADLALKLDREITLTLDDKQTVKFTVTKEVDA